MEEREVLSPSHVLAILNGAARPDADITAHFGSLFGMAEHLDAALRLGLVSEHPSDPTDLDAPTVVLTEAGQDFFRQFRLAELPEGRANHWHGSGAGEIADPARKELERRWQGLSTHAPGDAVP
jgi:hypothetical protein